MWKQLYEIANLLFNLGKDLQQNRSDIKQLETDMREWARIVEKEIKRLDEAIQVLAHEIQRSHENEAHEREKLALRLEIALLRAGKELPPADDAPKN